MRCQLIGSVAASLAAMYCFGLGCAQTQVTPAAVKTNYIYPPPAPREGEWPIWRDVPVETEDYDRIWRTVIDVVSERFPIAVLDREGGYIRTEWRPDRDLIGDYAKEYLMLSDQRKLDKYPCERCETRFVIRCYPAEKRLRMGLEVKKGNTDKLSPELSPEKIAIAWQGIPQEIQNRLRVTE
ncbi:MAG: hypothetical protein ABIK65_04930 [Candidatus Eisenbacteria bacterium]